MFVLVSVTHLTILLNFNHVITMINKAQLIRVVKETASRIDHNLTREQKQKVFNDVVDGLLRDGRITKKQQLAWTHPF